MMASHSSIPYHRSLERNPLGRDFCVGDLHGYFNLLENALESVGFDTERDRLISVGDLIDRGPQSPRVLEFLARPWFQAVRGNHEAMLLDNAESTQKDGIWLTQAGAEWWLALDEKQRAAYPGPLAALPYTLDIDTADGLVGVVHADVPDGLSWERFVAQMPHDEILQEYALWARVRIRRVQCAAPTREVAGLSLLVVGHTPVSPITFAHNVCFLDTGAAYAPLFPGAALTLLEIHPRRQAHSFPADSQEPVGLERS